MAREEVNAFRTLNLIKRGAGRELRAVWVYLVKDTVSGVNTIKLGA